MTDSIKDQVTIRDYTDVDLPFIYNTWLECYRETNAAKDIRDRVYYPEHHKLIENLFNIAMKVKIIHLSDSIDTVLGYLAYEPDPDAPIIHFIYMKNSFRGLRLARMLLEHAELNPNHCYYTHRTNKSYWIDQKFPGLIYNPYLSK